METTKDPMAVKILDALIRLVGEFEIDDEGQREVEEALAEARTIILAATGAESWRLD